MAVPIVQLYQHTRQLQVCWLQIHLYVAFAMRALPGQTGVLARLAPLERTKSPMEAITVRVVLLGNLKM